MEHLYQWIIVGLLGGILGKLLHPGDDSNGPFSTIILGVLGGLLGNFVATRFLGFSMTGINLPSIAIAGVGALVVLFIRRKMQQKK